ncbi:MAG: peptide chain release factor N(5)-glutamine methyltransferase [Neisseriaceae bacterium]
MINANLTIRSIIINSELDYLDIKLLINFITGLSKVELITRDDYQLTKLQYNKLCQLIDRRKKGEPLSYILGHKEFYSRNFKVTPNTLIPRPETELLVDTILELTKTTKPFDKTNRYKRLLDLGTGTGCIAITCKLENPDLEVSACDNDANTLAVACENANILNANVKFVLSNWFQNISDIFDIIVSNPPYIAADDEHLSQLKYEPIKALTDNNDGFTHIKTIITHSHRFLENGGYLLFEHGYAQGELSRILLQQAGFTNIRTIKDYAGLERITLGQYITMR